MPRHSSDSIRLTATSRGTGRSLSSHHRAATCAAPVSAIDSSSACGRDEPGVRGDGVGHGAHDRSIGPFDPLAHRRLVAEVGLEDQPERARPLPVAPSTKSK